jgi:hypothetical protein
MEAMQEYYASSIAEQQRLSSSLQELQQQLQQLQAEHAGCQAARWVTLCTWSMGMLHAGSTHSYSTVVQCYSI